MAQVQRKDAGRTEATEARIGAMSWPKGGFTAAARAVTAAPTAPAINSVPGLIRRAISALITVDTWRREDGDRLVARVAKLRSMSIGIGIADKGDGA